MKLAELQDKHKDASLCVADEVPMWGRKMTGHRSRRFDDIFNHGAAASAQDTGVPQYGQVPTFVWWGDPKQLEPVLDLPLATTPGHSGLAQLSKAT